MVAVVRRQEALGVLACLHVMVVLALLRVAVLVLVTLLILVVRAVAVDQGERQVLELYVLAVLAAVVQVNETSS